MIKSNSDSMLMKMLYGLLGHDEIELSEYYKKIAAECDNKEIEFIKYLQGSNMQREFIKLADLYLSRECESSNNFFAGGFKLGLLLALEVLGFTPPKEKE